AGPRPSNLWEPVPGRHATRGAFTDEARRAGAEAGLGASRALAFGAAVAVLAAAFSAARKWHR
ncbi:short-chain dehydrogenase, partial [Burkholderia sp. IO2]|nr:short-chain dehydrogenase [Burkholderia sp. IO2]